MIVLSNSATQTLQPGESLVLDVVVHRSGRAECFDGANTIARLGASGMYDIDFNANIAAVAAGPVQLSLQYNGVTLPETTMISTPTAADAFNNVSASTEVKSVCCQANVRTNGISVTNTGATAVTVNARTTALKIVRRA